MSGPGGERDVNSCAGEKKIANALYMCLSVPSMLEIHTYIVSGTVRTGTVQLRARGAVKNAIYEKQLAIL